MPLSPVFRSKDLRRIDQALALVDELSQKIEAGSDPAAVARAQARLDKQHAKLQARGLVPSEP